jgi:hypothetical protein
MEATAQVTPVETWTLVFAAVSFIAAAVSVIFAWRSVVASKAAAKSRERVADRTELIATSTTAALAQAERDYKRRRILRAADAFWAYCVVYEALASAGGAHVPGASNSEIERLRVELEWAVLGLGNELPTVADVVQNTGRITQVREEASRRDLLRFEVPRRPGITSWAALGVAAAAGRRLR